MYKLENMLFRWSGWFSALLVTLASSACGPSAEEKQRECDSIASDIRRDAALRGVSSQGICSSTNQQIQKDFGVRCQQLKECNDEVAELR